MRTEPSNRISVIAAIMVGVGALLTSGLNFLFVLWGVPSVPRVYFLPDPAGWALRPRVDPVAVLGMLVALVLLVALTWLFVRWVVRGAIPARAAAVFFGTWGAIVIAGLVTGVVRAPIVLISLRIPADQTDIYQMQFFQIATTGATWGLMWGWIVAIVAALLHRNRTGSAPMGAPYAGTYAAPPAQYAPQQSQPGQFPAFPSAQQFPPHPPQQQPPAQG